MAGRPRRTTQMVYEDFKPTSRWEEDTEKHTLIIDLPGFVKDQLRVSVEEQDIIKVRGERPVNRNRGARFQENFQAPANSDLRTISAMFVEKSLIITVEKRNANKPEDAPHPPAKAAAAEIPSHAQPKTQQGRDEHRRHPTAVEPAKAAAAEISNHAQPKTQQGGDEHQQHAKAVEPASQPRDDKSLEPTVTDPGKKGDQPDHVLRDGRRGTPFKDAGRVLPRDDVISEVTGQHATEKTSKRSEELAEGGTAKKAKLETGDTSAAKEINEESKGKHEDHNDGADIGISGMKKDKEAVKRVVTEVNEERQLLVNMGVAVAVIIALSAYVTYHFTSGKHNN